MGSSIERAAKAAYDKARGLDQPEWDYLTDYGRSWWIEEARSRANASAPRRGTEMVCPYCLYEEGDSWEISPDDTDGVLECEHCDKEYEWIREIHVTYETRVITGG